MDIRRLVWLAVPLLGLLELALHSTFAARAPGPEEWSALAGAVERIARPGDLVVVTPAWAEPLARQALGERWMPLADLARDDLTSRRSAVEVSLLGARADELAEFREIARSNTSGFVLRRLENAAVVPALYRFVDHVHPGALRVREVGDAGPRDCEYTERARSTAGGLGGHVAYPRARFRCSGGESFFVGVTLMDDQRYRPRRCLFAHPVEEGALRLEFRHAPIGRVIAGSTGTSYLLARDGAGTDVELRVLVDGREIGRAVQRDEQGFQPFAFEVAERRGERAEVVFEIRSASAHAREFCFTAETR